jgi:hypothetical protein
LPDGQELGEQMVTQWIADNAKKITAAANDDNPFN